MGIVTSKGEKNTPLLNLCKERKELIRATRDARYRLSKSHFFYFQSLLELSNALNQFVHKDLTVIPYSSDNDSSSSELICSGSDSDSDCLACDRCSTVPLSNNKDQSPRNIVSGDGTCGLGNNVQEFEEKEEFLNSPTEYEVRASKNLSLIEQSSFPSLDIFGLYGFADNTQFVFTEADESDGWREVREREGIPDLESDSDHNNYLIRKNQKKNKKKNVQESYEVNRNDVKASPCHGQIAADDNGSCENCEQETRNPLGIDTEDVRRSGEEAYEFSSLESCGSRLTDLRNILEKINCICEKAMSNSEVSELLEVSKVVHHRPLGSQFKGFASKVLGSYGNSTRDSLSKRGGLRQENLPGSLSMTLEKLSIWEKKLYTEVTVAEKLRVSYEKGYMILKSLDQNGAEPSKIYEAEAVVKQQLSKINVSVRAVESISMRIHKIRDEELLYQVTEIINGFKEMWRVLAKCHHKQFRAIGRSKSCVHIVEKGSSSRKATQKVQVFIGRYRELLKGYIDAQRDFIKLINEWLNRNIMEGDETKVEAPEIFRVCSEWTREIDQVDETKVLSAVEEMEMSFRGLGLMQVEEEKQRVRTERLCKELEKKTKEADEIWGTVVAYPELLSLRESVAQEKENHERMIRELNDVASMTLQEKLVFVFDALEDFSFGNFQAYQNIRIASPKTLLLGQS